MRRALADARGKQKLDLLLSAPDARQLVQALPAEDLYLALLDVGPDDAAEVVALATPQQFRHFIDMAAWRARDEGPRAAEVLHWLRLAREGGHGADAAEARFRRQLAGLDVELLALVLRRELRVHDLTEEDSPEPENPGHAFYTSDRRFMLEFSGSAEFSSLRRLVEDLYAQDPFAAGRLIESVRWEVPTELEESARRWRDGRLRDAGVPDFEEAIAFYARPAQRGGEQRSPALSEQVNSVHQQPAPAQALAAPRRPLLDAALDLLGGAELEDAEEALVYAANAALVANRVPLDDADEVREQLAQARATLGLGLELLSDGDPQRAARVLVERPIREVFQAAMGEAYRLQVRARRFAPAARLPQAQSATLLDEPLESALQALLQQRPEFHQPGQRRRSAFGSRADVAQAEALLDDAEATLALLNALGLSPAELGAKAEEAGLGPAALKASGAVRALVESQLRGEPFSLRSVSDESPLPPDFDRKLDEILARSPPAEAGRRAAERIRSILHRNPAASGRK